MICIFITAHKNTLSSKSLEDCARQVIAATGEECRVTQFQTEGMTFYMHINNTKIVLDVS